MMYEDAWDEGYLEGYGDGVGDTIKSGFEDEKMLSSGLIKRTHNYNGEIVHLWIEGPDFKGDRYAW